MKILIKILFASTLIVLSPIIFFFMLLVLIENGKPALFIQERLGKNMTIIRIYKIRTMKNNTPNLGTHEVNNSNYLKVGSILRKTKIDELPQVLNYLNGDINLIGPRPGLPNQLELKKYRELNRIFDVKPGITGLAQVLGYDMSKPELLALVDRIYINNKSIKLDLLIFLATFFRFAKNIINKLYGNDIKEMEDKIKNV